MNPAAGKRRFPQLYGWALPVLAAILPLQVTGGLAAQNGRSLGPQESGGILSPEQATFDVLSYDLAITLYPDQKSIQGTLRLNALILHPTSSILLDLDEPMAVHAVRCSNPRRTFSSPRFDRTARQLRVYFPATLQPGWQVSVEVDYSGKPREAQRPPWRGGFVWRKDSSGHPWVGVACQLDGADLWWPCKDHPSDEPNRMDIRVTVPLPLVVASNGVLREVTEHADRTRTYHWEIINPINTYNVTLNAASYQEIAGSYRSVAGDLIPLRLWVLPEDYTQGVGLMGDMVRHLQFLEERLGPYPFRNEKYGVAQTDYLGMEHQTIISYGSRFQKNRDGFDWLHLHELAHEWWGNQVSAADWKDYWIHEGFASYMEALYAESLGGGDSLRRYMSQFRGRLRNKDPLAPFESRTTVQKYFAFPDHNHADGDVNFKGAWVIHTLRYLVGDEAFFTILRRFLYPSQENERLLDGGQCRFVATEDFIHVAETLAERELDWFFRVYLRQPGLPRLLYRRDVDSVTFTWESPDGLPFPMPVVVEVAGVARRLDFTDSASHTIPARTGDTVTVDPDGWILMDSPQ